MDCSELVYAATSKLIKRSCWMHRRCASEQAGWRCDWGRKKARTFSKVRQERAGLLPCLNPPLGGHHGSLP